MLHSRAVSLCKNIINIKQHGLAVIFNNVAIFIKENAIKYNTIPDKWMAVVNTFLLINHLNNGKTLTGENDTSYLTEQEELVSVLYPIAEKADNEGYNDEQFFDLCVKTLSDNNDRTKKQ